MPDEKKKQKEYELTDLLIAYLVTLLRKEINRLDVMGFDELSAPRITKITKEILKRLLKENKEAFIRIATAASEEAADDIKKLSGIGVKPITTDGKYVDDYLGQYNAVTGYLYYPEADRKRARVAEALIAAVIFGNRNEYHKELKKFADLWHTQTLQYGEGMVDTARLDTFKKNGIKYVMWRTQEDLKVCKECRERNGKIYPIDKFPGKAHYRCRCWTIPVLEKDVKNGNNGES